MKLIDADKLIHDIGTLPALTPYQFSRIVNVINEQPPVDSRTGSWIVSQGEGFECSRCWRINDKPTPYCPTCGSRNRLMGDE